MCISDYAAQKQQTYSDTGLVGYYSIEFHENKHDPKIDRVSFRLGYCNLISRMSSTLYPNLSEESVPFIPLEDMASTGHLPRTSTSSQSPKESKDLLASSDSCFHQPCVAYNVIPTQSTTEHHIHIHVPELVKVWLKSRKLIQLPNGATVKLDKSVESSFDSTTQLLVIGDTTRIHGTQDTAWMASVVAALKEVLMKDVSPYSILPEISMVGMNVDVPQPAQVEIYISPWVFEYYKGPLGSDHQKVYIDANTNKRETKIWKDDDDDIRVEFNGKDWMWTDPKSIKLWAKYSDRILTGLRGFDKYHSQFMVKTPSPDSPMASWSYPGLVNIDRDQVAFIEPIHITLQEYKWATNQRSCFKSSNGIIINCSNGRFAGFRNGALSVVDVSPEVINKDWIPIRGRDDYKANMARVQEAVREFKKAAAQDKSAAEAKRKSAKGKSKKGWLDWF